MAHWPQCAASRDVTWCWPRDGEQVKFSNLSGRQTQHALAEPAAASSSASIIHSQRTTRIVRTLLPCSSAPRGTIGDDVVSDAALSASDLGGSCPLWHIVAESPYASHRLADMPTAVGSWEAETWCADASSSVDHSRATRAQ